MNSCNLTVADKQTISRTTAQSMAVQTQYVQFMSCNVSRNLTTISGISVELQASIPLVDFNSKNATNVYNQLLDKLSSSVSNGNFTKTLQKVSVELGASNTKNATVKHVSFSQVVVQNPPTFAPTQKPSYASHASSKSNKRLSDGAITGIVIGCVAFVVLLLSFVYYYWISRKSSKIGSTYTHEAQQLVLSEINVAAV